MEKFIVEGKRPLTGSVKIHGAKNAVLPILAATVISGRQSVIYDCPDLSDVSESLKILEFLGCSTKREGSVVTVKSESIITDIIPEQLMLKMRSSIIFLGALAARLKSATITLPGGCEIGPRPIDLHLKAFRQMGMIIDESCGEIYCDAKNLHSADIHLDFPSVGATENVMLAACGAQGITTISNAAKEPEIEDLQKFLNSMGARVTGAGTNTIYIEGAKVYNDVTHTVIPDRIETATYIAAVLITGGDALLTNVEPAHIQALLSVLNETGAELILKGDTLRVASPNRLLAVKRVRTYPYPGFPTDMQSIFMSLMTTAQGTCVIAENIFHDRFRQVDGLLRMGADIVVDGQLAVVKGTPTLYGAHVSAADLRGGAALTVAALGAQGTSEIENVCYIDRGYERFEDNLRLLGADIQRR
ncbi:MAG: UDP-N-acetylglucosamine 1-carboxyvinyltransferase [Bacillota bacterium]|nr:UDP-N-acetylglucosamine 1-carboxyvinyltransferase [Bacillota bacterium]